MEEYPDNTLRSSFHSGPPQTSGPHAAVIAACTPCQACALSELEVFLRDQLSGWVVGGVVGLVMALALGRMT
jgi:hypothetical protein